MNAYFYIGDSSWIFQTCKIFNPGIHILLIITYRLSLNHANNVNIVIPFAILTTDILKEKCLKKSGDTTL